MAIPLYLDTSNTEKIGTTLTTSGNGIALQVNNPQLGEALKGTSTWSDGVHGASSRGEGVHGESNNGTGVFGESRADTSDRQTQAAGVFGSSANQPIPERGQNGTNVGVWGDSVIDIGVLGSSVDAPAISGFSQTNHGTVGISESSRGGAGVVGIAWGPGEGVVGQAQNNHGVHGISSTRAGVLGETSGTLTAAVGGFSTTTSGVFGITTSSGSAGVIGSNGGQANAWAGFFLGDVGCSRLFADSLIRVNSGTAVFGGLVDVLGALIVAGLKLAVVPHPDGTYRGLYSLESPESWFEDFGRAKVVKGKAAVKLDPAFVAVVRSDDYHIFLSPEGASKGLYMSRINRSGFEVREQEGGTSTLPFSYRVVARRRDVQVKRLEKMTLPWRDEVANVPKGVPKKVGPIAQPPEVKMPRLPISEVLQVRKLRPKPPRSGSMRGGRPSRRASRS